jgi:hypothetical protein
MRFVIWVAQHCAETNRTVANPADVLKSPSIFLDATSFRREDTASAIHIVAETSLVFEPGEILLPCWQLVVSRPGKA